MKQLSLVLCLLLLTTSLGSAQVIANFEKDLGGYHVLTQYFGSALTGVAQKADPTGKSAGVMVCRFNFTGAGGDKGGLGVNNSILTKGARFITYWVYLPTSTPDSLNFYVFAQDNQNYEFRQNMLLGKDIPKNTWYPLSMDLAQAGIDDSKFDLVKGNIFLTGIQIDNYTNAAIWKDSILVDNVALVGATPVTVADFESDLGGYHVLTQYFGKALTAASVVPDPTGKSAGAMQCNFKFTGAGGDSGKGAVGANNAIVTKGAPFITYWVNVPTSTPDSVNFSVFAQDSKGYQFHQNGLLGKAIPKNTWYPISLDLAQAGINDPNFDLVNGNIYLTGIQVDNYANAAIWKDSILIDNVALLSVGGPATYVAGGPTEPYQYRLYNNYPNPFNPSTTIRYELKREGNVALKVYDDLGREVATLVDERQQAGPHVVVFDARRLASGMYFYTIRAGSFTKTEKMMLLK